jgi:6-phosphofructokinase 2
MGARGVVGISRGLRCHVTPPKINVRSSIGAGDSLVAGIVFALSQGGTFEDSLIQGVACGTASALNSASGHCTKEDLESIKKDVHLEKI